MGNVINNYFSVPKDDITDAGLCTSCASSVVVCLIKGIIVVEQLA